MTQDKRQNDEWKKNLYFSIVVGITYLQHSIYKGCPESIRPFWISWEFVAWPWYNLAASQRKPCCSSVNSHSPLGLVSRQWDAVNCACVLCDRRIHNDRASRSASSRQCSCPFYSSRAGFFFFLVKHHIAQVCKPPTAQIWLPATSGFSQIAVESEDIVNATVTQYTSSVNGVSLPTDLPHRRVTVHGCAVRSPLTGCQDTSRPRDRF